MGHKRMGKDDDGFKYAMVRVFKNRKFPGNSRFNNYKIAFHCRLS